MNFQNAFIPTCCICVVVYKYLDGYLSVVDSRILLNNASRHVTKRFSKKKKKNESNAHLLFLTVACRVTLD